MKEKSPALQDEEDQEATSPESKEVAPRDELAELRRQNEELVTKLKYLQAEFENYRKRADRDAETVVKFAHELLISRLLPDVLVKGGDWPGDQIVGREEVEAAGGRVVSIPFVTGYSTTSMLQKVREGSGPSSVIKMPQPKGKRESRTDS